MNTYFVLRRARAGLALTVLLLVLCLLWLAGLAYARGGNGPGTVKGLPPLQTPPPGNMAPTGDGLWTPLGGPTIAGGQVGALAVDPTLSGTLWVAVQPPAADWGIPAAIYQSSDGAANWTAVYTTFNRVVSLEARGNLLYAGAYNEDDWTPWPLLYRSTDGGASWTVPLSITGGTIWDLDIHPTNPQIAIAGGGDYPDKASLYQTADGGATWVEVFSYTMPGWYPTVNSVLIHPTNPLLWLFTHDGQVGGTWGSYLYRSTDGGTSWTPVYTLTEDVFAVLAANPVSPNTLYASTWLNNFYRSTDGGATWTAVITDGSAGSRLVVEPPTTLYAVRGNSNEVRVSTDEGDSWDVAGTVNGNLWTLAIDLGPVPAALYAGLGDGSWGVYKSTDGGVTWEERNNGIETPAPPRDIDVDPQNRDKMFAAAECAGGWMTTDGGWNWTLVDEACMGAFAINPQNPNIVYGGEYNCNRGPVVRSEDGGLTFRPAFTPTFIISDCSGGDETIFALAIAASPTSTVYAVGADHPNWSGDQAVAVRSLDDGVSWTVVFTLPEWSRLEAVAIDPTDDEVVYLGGRDCSGVSGPGCVGFVYRSTDGGDSWDLTLVTSDTVTSIVVDYQKPTVLYVSDRSYTVRKSTDGGDSWTVVRPCCPSGYLLALDPHVPSHIYLAGWGYIAETTDGGQSWSEWSDPINWGTPPMDPFALTVDSGALTQTLYAGFTGVWAYTRPAPQPGEAMAITMWAEPITNPLYANGLHPFYFHALVLDRDENWVANGTPVTVTYDHPAYPPFSTIKRTKDGHIMGGWMGGISTPGIFTFTATANVTATAVVTKEFLYNPPAGIDLVAAPASIGLGGQTAVVTATVAGLHDGIASDGTEVAFETSLGTIDATALTVGGVATATLTSGSTAGTAVITATTDGFFATTTVEFTGFKVYLPLVVKNH